MTVDLDELDRLHAAATEKPWNTFSAMEANRFYPGVIMRGVDWKAAGATMNAYPALAAEIRALRAKVEYLDRELREAVDDAAKEDA